MSYDRMQIIGSVLVLLAIVTLSALLIQVPFPAFEYAIPADSLIEITRPIGEEMSEFMWSVRNIDLLAQAFVLFSTAVGSLAVLFEIEHMNAEETE
ncbi:MAG: hypothetical protein ACOC38_05205 [Promethearchaeia archaeon]